MFIAEHGQFARSLSYSMLFSDQYFITEDDLKMHQQRSESWLDYIKLNVKYIMALLLDFYLIIQ